MCNFDVNIHGCVAGTRLISYKRLATHQWVATSSFKSYDGRRCGMHGVLLSGILETAVEYEYLHRFAHGSPQARDADV